MNDSQKKNLIKTIEETAEWERISTSVEGLFVVKPPEHNNKQVVYVELIPSINGQVTKKRGIYLKSIEDLESYRKIIENPKTDELISVISEFYGVRKTPKIEI